MLQQWLKKLHNSMPEKISTDEANLQYPTRVRLTTRPTPQTGKWGLHLQSQLTMRIKQFIGAYFFAMCHAEQ